MQEKCEKLLEDVTVHVHALSEILDKIDALPDGAEKKIWQMAVGSVARIAAHFCVVIDQLKDKGIEGAAELLEIEYVADDEPGPEKLN